MVGLRASDNFRDKQFGGVKLPQFEGRLKLTLHNCKNHKDEVVIEGKNLITNAVRDILARNLNGGLDYSRILPLVQSYYGGVLLYQNAHTIDADNYFPDDDLTNPLVAHAGDQAPSSALIVAEDYGRGSPVSVVSTSSSIKQTWEWGTEQGGLHGGVISAISLTHKDVGNAGLGNTSTEFQNLNPFVNLSNLTNINVGGTPVAYANNIMSRYDDRNGFLFLIGDDGDYYDGHHIFQTSKITVYIIPLAYSKIGLHTKNIPTYDYVSKFTVTTSVTFYGMPAYYFDYTNKKLWLFSNMTGNSAFSQSVCNYSVIDCVTKTEETHGTITSDDNDLGIISMNGNFNAHAFPRVTNIIKDGNYVYLPLGLPASSLNFVNGTVYYKGLKKIDITNQADQTVILNNTQQTYSKPYTRNGGIIINGNRVFNGGVGYNCSVGYFTSNDVGNPTVSFWSLHEPDKVSSLAYPFRAYDGSSSQPRLLLASKFVNTSLFNLPNGSVTKTGTMSMTLEYTLTEV